jgi:hypothetical protein
VVADGEETIGAFVEGELVFEANDPDGVDCLRSMNPAVGVAEGEGEGIGGDVANTRRRVSTSGWSV